MALEKEIMKLEAAQERRDRYVALKEHVVRCVAEQMEDGNRIGWLLTAHEECERIIEATRREIDHARNAIDRSADT